MHSNGQIESLVCEAVNAFLRGAMGRGATTMSATLRPCALFVHLREVLTLQERALAAGDHDGVRRGEVMVREARDLLVRRSHDELSSILARIIGRRPTAILHDVDPGTGDELIAFTFAPVTINSSFAHAAVPSRNGVKG